MTSSLDRVAWPVRTERLTVRRARADDLEATWRFRRLEQVSYWLTSSPRTLEDYRKKFEDPGRLRNTLVVELDGEVIGDLLLAVSNGWAQQEVAAEAEGTQADVGWVLDPAHGGQGYATEAVEALLRICFEDLGLRRVVAGCFADNEPSWRLMERVGMRRELHAVRESLHRTKGWLDGFGYALLREEWAGRQGASS
jgi:RimJ/RimL family protein N-acetyltransferase